MKTSIRFLLLSIICIFSLQVFATHIVGGSLTYVYNGGTSYLVTLKLYRDCGPTSASFPTSVVITVVGYDGAGNLDFTMNNGAITSVPSNLDSCAIPPNPMPCVEERIYSKTVDLPPNPGGYHLYFQIVARNLSITNIDASGGGIGETYYAYIPGLPLDWHENFVLGNGTIVDNGSTAWSTSAGATPPNSAQITANKFAITGADDGEQTWRSEQIDISNFPTGAALNVALTESGTLDASDSVAVYYSLNGGAITLFSTNGVVLDDFTSRLAHQAPLIGDSVQIIVRVHFEGNSPNTEIYNITKVIVGENDMIVNNNPVFTLFPPLFLCLGEAFTFDHAATDADGDSLVYSLYNPYDGEGGVGPLDPTFSGNLPTFDPVLFEPGYSTNNPLGGAPISLNSSTGLLTGTPPSLGQFVVGVKVTEYRNGVYLSETLRDFQFNIVTCPQPGPAVLNPISSCTSYTVDFSNAGAASNTDWLWNFGNLSSTTDTSTNYTPSYTYPDTGSYVVTLITNYNTVCADTAVDNVYIGWILPVSSNNSPKCAGQVVTFAGSETHSNNIGSTTYSWDFGDGSSSTLQNPTHSYAAGGTYTAILYVISNLGCSDTSRRTVNITTAATASAGVDQTVCSNNALVTLAGVFANATGVSWSSSGSGTFSNSTSISSSYTPSTADTAAGTRTLTIVTTGNGSCPAATDNMIITYSNSPTTAAAGGDQTICGVTTATMAANTPSSGETGTWTFISGTGTITNPNSPTTTITGLVAGSSYTLRWTISRASCVSSFDNVVINVDQLPTTAAANTNQTLCNSTTATLAANTPSVGSGLWTFVAGTATIANPSLANSGITGITIGSTIILRWTISSGLCSNFDEVQISSAAAPTANAGGNITICKSTTSIGLTGNATNQSSVLWSTSGTGTFTNGNTLAPTYTPSAGDLTGTSVTLSLTVSGTLPCSNVVSTMVLSFSSIATANAGGNQSMCKSNSSITLGGTATNQTLISWSSSGSGVFTNGNTATPTYTPSASDLSTGSVTLTITANATTPCANATNSMLLSFINVTTVNSGGAQSLCKSSSAITLTGTANNQTSLLWTSSGTGTFTNGTTLSPTYTPSAGDLSGSNVTLTLSATATSPCANVSSPMVLSFVNIPTANAGGNQSMCKSNSSFTLSGSATNQASVSWSSSGTGTFTNGTTVSPTYTPSALDLSVGNVTLTLTAVASSPCSNVTNSMVLTFINIPTANSGGAQSMCKSNASISLTGTASNQTSVLWTTNGTGTFSGASTLTPSYIPTAADLSLGSVTITLTATGTAPCANATNSMVLTFQNAPTSSTGGNQGMCKDNTSINLIGSATNYTSVLWSTNGTGTFSIANSLTTGYSPSAADIASGSTTLTLTAIGNASCSNGTNTMILTYINAPTANAGGNQSMCKDVTSINLSGTAANQLSQNWSTTGTGSFVNGSTLTPTYSPTAAEFGAGSVTISLTTTGTTPCANASSAIVLSFVNAPTANAGGNQSMCKNNTSITLSGTATNQTSVVWTSNGTGIFINANGLSPTYTPSSNDVINGAVIITFTVSGNSPCINAVSTMNLSFITAPTVSSGGDQGMCKNNTSINLTGTASNQTSMLWSTSGTGSFTNGTSLATTYTPTASDISLGSVTINLTVAGNSPCANVVSPMVLSFINVPTASAGTTLSLCKNVSSINVVGTATNQASLFWTTSGSGTFTNASILNPTYSPSTADFNANTVNLTLTVTGTSNCTNVTSIVPLNFINVPTASAGANQSMCKSSSTINLTGTATNQTSVVWSSSGTGTFINNNTLTPTYTPTTADMNAGSVTISLRVFGIAPCVDITSTMTLSFVEIPVVNGGGNQSMCKSSSSINLVGTASNQIGLAWTTSGTGSFLNSTSLTPTYFPSSLDLTNGTVSITLTGNGNSPCANAISSVILTFVELPTASISSSFSMCKNTNSINLSSNVANQTSLSWTSSGTGSFTNGNTNAPTYSPSAADFSSSSVTLTLSAIASPCSTAQVSSVLSFINLPVVSAGSDQSICYPSTTQINISGTITGGTTTGSWATTGIGNFSNPSTTLTNVYNINANDTSLTPIVLVLSSTNNGPCPIIRDTILLSLYIPPNVEAGSNQTVCANNAQVNLSGSVAGITSSGTWLSGGDGTFNNQNNLNTIYNPGINDINSGNVTLFLNSTNNFSCNSISDSIIVTITSKPLVVSGLDQTVCSTSLVSLNGSISGGSTSGIWRTLGNGTFTPDSTSLNTNYNFSANDISVGTVKIILRSTNNGNCYSELDTIKISIFKIAVVNAGIDKSICYPSSTNVSLAGTITGSTSTGIWSHNGLGTMSPSSTNLNTTYIVNSGDVAKGVVKIFLTSTNNGPCPAKSDSLDIIIAGPSIANSGTSKIVCSNVADVQLAGNFSSIFTSGSWTTNGTGTFSPSKDSLNTRYVPSTLDIFNGSVILKLSSTNNGSCASSTDTMKITFKVPAIANAGADQSFCSTKTLVTLSGSVSGGSTTGLWSTSGTGTFSSTTSSNTSYTTSTGDINNGKVYISLISSNSGVCGNDTDIVELNISKLAVVAAIADTSICSSQSKLQLNATISGITTSGQWTTSGTGNFSPSNTTLNAFYTPSATEITNGLAVLTLTSTNNGLCNSVKDVVNVKILKPAIVQSGADIAVCSNSVTTKLNGIVAGGTVSGKWETNGTGTFVPNNTTLTATYNPSQVDIASGKVILVLNSTNNKYPCPVIKDTTNLKIIQLPVVKSMNDTSMCSNLKRISVSSLISGGSGAGHWSSNSGGTFSPDADSNPAIYTPNQHSSEYLIIDLIYTSTANGPCAAAKSTTKLRVNNSPDAAFTPSKKLVYIPVDKIKFTNDSKYANSYSWNFGDGGTNIAESPTYNYTTVGNYIVTLIAKNKYECVDTSRSQITVSGGISYPNAFSPNPESSSGGAYNRNELNNDVFFPYTDKVLEYHLLVFNRWGELIFESFDVNVGWDGYYRGKLCQQDAYVWKAEVKFYDQTSETLTGNVTLLR